VTDVNDAPKAGVSIRWTVSTGGGSVQPGMSVTDPTGVAEASATLGNASGPQTVHARASGYQGSPVSFTSTGLADAPAAVQQWSGNHQTGPVNATLPLPLVVRVLDRHGNLVPGIPVDWTVTAGGGTTSAASSLTDAQGEAATTLSLPGSSATVTVAATVAGIAQPATFSATATNGFTVLAGGNNVPDRFSSDLWVADGYGYTGTWGLRAEIGDAVKIWRLDPGGAPVLVQTLVVPGVGRISDLQVSPDGGWLVLTTEGGTVAGLSVYDITTPESPVFLASAPVLSGFHTGTLAVIDGVLYAFVARNNSPAMVVYDLSQAASGTLTIASSTSVPAYYGIHDTFVRDGICFAFLWDTGVYVYDVGGGGQGGSPQFPAKLGGIRMAGGMAHNGWWFHNPASGEKRYLFVGQEGPTRIGVSSSGDIHVLDVSDFSNPVEVAKYHRTGAGPHNFWMDEQRQILYAAYYNGGVVALDVSGVLSGDLASREIARIQPGGAGNTFVWGVMLQGGSLYASDMLSGFWQLQVP